MAKVLSSPGKYIQGKNVIAEMDKYIEGLGDKILLKFAW
jgi:glycerol dehydrogenase